VPGPWASCVFPVIHLSIKNHENQMKTTYMRRMAFKKSIISISLWYWSINGKYPIFYPKRMTSFDVVFLSILIHSSFIGLFFMCRTDHLLSSAKLDSIFQTKYFTILSYVLLENVCRWCRLLKCGGDCNMPSNEGCGYLSIGRYAPGDKVHQCNIWLRTWSPGTLQGHFWNALYTTKLWTVPST
jgi:hypothetical protein